MIKKYKEYKLSKFKWFEHVPVNWHEGKISYFFEIGRGRVISELELNSDAPYPVYSSQTKNDGCLGFIDTYDFDDNILTWTTDGANAGTVFIRSGKFNCTNVCGTLKPKVNVDLKYYLYYLQTMTPFYKRPDTNGAKIMNNEMARIYCLIPPIQEQTKIAQYLDTQTATIDQLIQQKEKLIELLKEKRQVVINEAVTKGLNPNAKMKDSGIEWLRDVPEHWEVKKLKYLVTINSNQEVLSETPFKVALENIESGTGKFIESNSENQFEGVGNFFKDGDVLFNKLRPYLAKVYLAKQAGYSVGELLVLTPKPIISSEFLFYRLLSPAFIEIVNGSTYGAKMPRASWNFIGNLSIPVPNKNEQVEIVNFIEEFYSKSNSLIFQSTSQIEKLKEYRQSIISEAVTGKIDVRDWQPNKQQVA